VSLAWEGGSGRWAGGGRAGVVVG